MFSLITVYPVPPLLFMFLLNMFRPSFAKLVCLRLNQLCVDPAASDWSATLPVTCRFPMWPLSIFFVDALIRITFLRSVGFGSPIVMDLALSIPQCLEISLVHLFLVLLELHQHYR